MSASVRYDGHPTDENMVRTVDMEHRVDTINH